VGRTSISLPPLWREGRLGLEVASLLRDPVWSGEDVRDARGQPVLLIPGFLAGDGSLGLLTNWLRRTGHHTSRAGVRLNVGCSGSLLDRIEERAERLAERQGSRVAIVGQSRGGSLARAMARRRPDLISGVVALGSPLTSQLAIHPVVRAQVYALGALGTLGAPGLFGQSCLTGECCETFRDDLVAKFPREVGFLSIYSKTDGIVDWRACLDPAARQVEIHSSHIGMSANPAAYREIASALAKFRTADARRRSSRRGRRRRRAGQQLRRAA
jgi:pimeloyl-ACP methyl ester carboxylesterase